MSKNNVKIGGSPMADDSKKPNDSNNNIENVSDSLISDVDSTGGKRRRRRRKSVKKSRKSRRKARKSRRKGRKSRGRTHKRRRR